MATGENATGENVVVYAGTQAQASVYELMLRARGISAVVTFDREIEGGTAVVEALLRVPPDQADEARALIADIDANPGT